jgi:hypothetical protein
LLVLFLFILGHRPTWMKKLCQQMFRFLRETCGRRVNQWFLNPSVADLQVYNEITSSCKVSAPS